MPDDESRTAKPNLARGLADDLIRFVGDDPQVDQSLRPIRQSKLATQKLGHHPPRLRDLGADIPHLEVQPSEREPQIALQQSVADGPDPVILIDHLIQRSFAVRIRPSSPLGRLCTKSPHDARLNPWQASAPHRSVRRPRLFNVNSAGEEEHHSQAPRGPRDRDRGYAAPATDLACARSSTRDHSGGSILGSC